MPETTTVSVPDDEGQPLVTGDVPAGYVDRRDLMNFQFVALSDDFRKQRFSLPDGTLKFALRNPRDPKNAWAFDHVEIQASQLYQEAWPIIEKNLVKAHTRGIENEEHELVRTVAVSHETVQTMFVIMEGRNSPFKREILTVSTDHGRVFKYDPQCPTNLNQHDCARERRLTVVGSNRKEKGYSGTFVYDFTAKRWVAMRDGSEAKAVNELSKDGEDLVASVNPKMYRVEQYQSDRA